MGFTLRAALSELPQDAEVVMTELVPGVVAWAKNELAEVHGDSLADARVRIVEDDVAQPVRAAPAAWDAILLDVDNGPDGITVESNDRLYAPAGLAAARAALRPHGVLAVWSSGPDSAFTGRLRRAGFAVDEQVVRGGSGARHVIWLAGAPG
jgi:spermidine synthase